jgi:hypothetical protein
MNGFPDLNCLVSNIMCFASHKTKNQSNVIQFSFGNKTSCLRYLFLITMHTLLFVVHQFPWLISNHEIKNSTTICHHTDVHWLFITGDSRIYICTKIQNTCFFHKTRKLVSTIVKDFTAYLRIPSKPQKSVPTNLNFFTIFL